MSLHCHNSLVSCLLRPLASIEEHSPDAHREERIVMTMQCAQLNCITASAAQLTALGINPSQHTSFRQYHAVHHCAHWLQAHYDEIHTPSAAPIASIPNSPAKDKQAQPITPSKPEKVANNTTDTTKSSKSDNSPQSDHSNTKSDSSDTDKSTRSTTTSKSTKSTPTQNDSAKTNPANSTSPTTLSPPSIHLRPWSFSLSRAEAQSLLADIHPTIRLRGQRLFDQCDDVDDEDENSNSSSESSSHLREVPRFSMLAPSAPLSERLSSSSILKKLHARLENEMKKQSENAGNCQWRISVQCQSLTDSLLHFPSTQHMVQLSLKQRCDFLQDQGQRNDNQVTIAYYKTIQDVYYASNADDILSFLHYSPRWAKVLLTALSFPAPLFLLSLHFQQRIKQLAINPQFHYRVVVHQGHLNACSQRSIVCYHSSLGKSLPPAISQFFTSLQETIPFQTYVADILYIPGEEEKGKNNDGNNADDNSSESANTSSWLSSQPAPPSNGQNGRKEKEKDGAQGNDSKSQPQVILFKIQPWQRHLSLGLFGWARDRQRLEHGPFEYRVLSRPIPEVLNFLPIAIQYYLASECGPPSICDRILQALKPFLAICAIMCLILGAGYVAQHSSVFSGSDNAEHHGHFNLTDSL